MNDDAAREIKYALSDPARLCDKLGLLGDRRTFQRQSGGLLIRCPVHDDRSPSCSVQAKSGVVLWKCHACGASGDVLTLVAAIHGLTMSGDDFRQVLILGAELAGLHGLASSLAQGEARDRPQPMSRPEPAVEPERPYPPTDEVAALWSGGARLSQSEQAWAASRGLDPDLVGEHARALPAKGSLPKWASFRGQSWRETGHRLVVPVFDADGLMRSVRAIRIADGDTPKRLPPGGFKAGGLVLACEFAQAMLRGTYAPQRVLVVEGEPDFLSAATMRTRRIYARVGITSGSWSTEFARKVPPDAQVFIGTHDDTAGEKYANAIAETLPSHRLLRWHVGQVAA